MRSLLYSASLVLIAATTYLVLSFNYIRENSPKVFLKEAYFEAPESTSIFSTIKIGIHLPSHIKSGFALVHIEDNRLWNSDDSVFFLNGKKNSFFMNCSFADTGKKIIECYFVFPSLCTKMKKYINVNLALKPSIQMKNASTILMTTSAVSDTVNYVWEFENGLIVYANESNVALPVLDKGNYSGKLYIECRNYKSPEVKFDFSDELVQLTNIAFRNKLLDGKR